MDANKVVELLRQYMAIDDIEEVWRYAMWTDMALKLPITDDMFWRMTCSSDSANLGDKWYVELVCVGYSTKHIAEHNELSLAICEAWLEWRMAQDE